MAPFFPPLAPLVHVLLVSRPTRPAAAASLLIARAAAAAAAGTGTAPYVAPLWQHTHPHSRRNTTAATPSAPTRALHSAAGHSGGRDARVLWWTGLRGGMRATPLVPGAAAAASRRGRGGDGAAAASRRRSSISSNSGGGGGGGGGGASGDATAAAAARDNGPLALPPGAVKLGEAHRTADGAEAGRLLAPGITAGGAGAGAGADADADAAAAAAAAAAADAAAHPNRIYTVPNALTALRMALAPVVGYLIAVGSFGPAAGAVAAAGFLDWADGWVARRWAQGSLLGSFLDPLADKALVGATALALGWHGVLPAWLLVLVVGRDVLLVGGSFVHRALHKPDGEAFFALDKVDFRPQPSALSKFNTALQMGLVLAGVGHLAWGVPPAPLVDALGWAVAATTVASGAGYWFSHGFGARAAAAAAAAAASGGGVGPRAGAAAAAATSAAAASAAAAAAARGAVRRSPSPLPSGSAGSADASRSGSGGAQATPPPAGSPGCHPHLHHGQGDGGGRAGGV